MTPEAWAGEGKGLPKCQHMIGPPCRNDAYNVIQFQYSGDAEPKKYILCSEHRIWALGR